MKFALLNRVRFCGRGDGVILKLIRTDITEWGADQICPKEAIVIKV